MKLSVLLDLAPLAAPSVHRGVERYATELTRALHARARHGSLRVSALLDGPLLGRPRLTEDLPAALEQLGRSRRQGVGQRLGGALLRRLPRGPLAEHVDVVHSLVPSLPPRATLARPLVVTCHHVETRGEADEWHGTSGRVRTDPRHFERAARVLAISRATAQELITRLDVPREKIAVVHNGADLSRWTPEAPPDDASRLAALEVHGRPYLLGVGAVDARKNVRGVLAGLARAWALTGRRELGLLWVGRLSWAEQLELRRLARADGVEEAVRALGYVDDADLAALYRGATALTFVSKREGFGYPVVEAMACGCPVITSNRSSLIELAEGAALTVDPEDEHAIADAIVLVAGHDGERRRLSALGVARAAGFGLDAMLEGTLEAYAAAAQTAGAERTRGPWTAARGRRTTEP